MIAKLSYEGEINPHEYASILEDFQNNKPPGNEGIVAATETIAMAVRNNPAIRGVLTLT